MGDTKGFLKYERRTPTRRSVPVRLLDWQEVYEAFSTRDLRDQASRVHGLRDPVLQRGLPAG